MKKPAAMSGRKWKQKQRRAQQQSKRKVTGDFIRMLPRNMQAGG